MWAADLGVFVSGMAAPPRRQSTGAPDPQPEEEIEMEMKAGGRRHGWLRRLGQRLGWVMPPKGPEDLEAQQEITAEGVQRLSQSVNYVQAQRDVKVKEQDSAFTSNSAEFTSDFQESTSISSTSLSEEAEVSESDSVIFEKASPPPVQRLYQDFTNIDNIDKGGFGCVYKAQHRLDGKEYAIKQVKLTRRGEEVTKQEVRFLARLRHKNIIQYNTCWIEEVFASEDSDSSSGEGCNKRLFRCLFIQMELCKQTLKDWLSQPSSQENYKAETDKKFQQIVRGVAYIHKKKLIHRDLKPENILISFEDIIKISDFGLATTCASNNSMGRTPGVGTRSYMAPEQVGKKYGRKVDIFPLGLIWFEMLYRFGSEYEKAKMWKNVRKCVFPPEFIMQYPIEVPLIECLLSIEPFKRPSAKKFLILLNPEAHQL